MAVVAVRFVIVTELYPPSIGGQEFRYEAIAKGLVAAGHEVRILTVAHEADLPRESQSGGLVIERLVVDPKYVRPDARLPRTKWTVARFALAVWRRRKTLREANAVIFNQWPVLPQLLVARGLGGKAFVDWCEIHDGLLWWCIDRLVVRQCPRHLAVSDSVASLLKETRHVPEDSVCTVVSGVDVPELDVETPRRPLLLFLGRLVPHKNPLLLLEAFCLSDELRQKYRLAFAGDGPLREVLVSRSAAVGSVDVLGKVSDDQKAALLREAMLLVLPSQREGFPRVVAEAAAVGLPTLTIDSPSNGGAAVVRQYGIGWVCGASTDELGDAIANCAGDSEEWARVSRHCREVARAELSWDTVLTRLVAFTSPPVRRNPRPSAVG